MPYKNAVHVEITWSKIYEISPKHYSTDKEAQAMYYTLIKRRFSTNQSVHRVLSILNVIIIGAHDVGQMLFEDIVNLK